MNTLYTESDILFVRVYNNYFALSHTEKTLRCEKQYIYADLIWPLKHDAELAFMEIRHSYSTFPLKTAVPYPNYPTNGSVPDLVID